MAAGAGFWNFMAKSYARSPVSDEKSYQTKLEKTRGYLRDDMDVLEIGCGTGSTAILHAPLVKTYEGIDFSKKMLGFAEKKRKSAGLKNLTFTQMPIEDVSREAASLDAVLALSILHLLPSHKAVLAQIFDLLKPEGMLITSTVCVGDMRGIGKYLLSAGLALGILPPIQRFTKDELEALFVAAGFVLEDVWQPGRGAAVFIAARKPA